MTPRLAWVLLCLGVLAPVVYLLVDDDVARAIIAFAALAALLGAATLAALANRIAPVYSYVVAAASGLLLLRELFVRFFLDDPDPVSSALTVAVGLAVIYGLVALLRARHGSGWGDLLDGLIVGAGAWLIAWVTLIAPAIGGDSIRSLENIVTGLVLPLSAAELTLLATLAFTGLYRNQGAVLLMSGLLLGAVADSVFAVGSIRTDEQPSSVHEAIYVACYLLVAAGFCSPSIVGLHDRGTRPQLMTRPLRLGVAAAALLVPMLLLAVVPSRNTSDQVVRAISTAVLIGLGGYRLYRAVRAHDVAERELEARAHTDELTGLPNRPSLLLQVGRALDISWRTDERPTVMLFDIDRFKNINDSLGHRTGDQILQFVAQRLTALAEPMGLTVSRMSGDEFVILDPSTTSTAQALAHASTLQEAFQHPLALDHGAVFVTASIGVATAPANRSISPEDLLRHADIAMYRAKDAGRNTVALYDNSMQERLAVRMQVENALYGALERRELRLFYQPIVDTTSGEVSGFEALVRWQRPDGSVMSPIEFVPIAEETGTIISIGSWAMLEGLSQLRHWIDDGVVGPNATMSVNVSPRQLGDPNFSETVREAISRSGVSPHLLWLEVTESMMLSEPELARAALRRVRTMGVRIALDDFGTGYSSLSLLQQFPLQRIKIDRAFVHGVAESDNDRSLVRTILAMGGSLGLEVVAEGVESIHQLQVLRELGCTHAQGYLISHPVPAEAMRSTVSALEGLGSLPSLRPVRSDRSGVPMPAADVPPMRFIRPQV